MLKLISPLLTGSLLKVLDELGHGDVLGLVDRNFPAHRYQLPVIALRGADTQGVARAILSVFPLDSYVEAPISRMEVDGRPADITASTAALQQLADQAEGRRISIQSRERFDFYQTAKVASAFVQTGDTVPYSCYLLSKGVV